MKKILLLILGGMFVISNAFAVNMVKQESYLDTKLKVVGLPDYPPFSYYDYDNKGNIYRYFGAFIKPLEDAMQKYGFGFETPIMHRLEDADLKMLLLSVRGGQNHVFIGAYADTQLYAGLEILYPAVVSNPIHIFTLPDNSEQVRDLNNLKKLKGVVSKTEYLSDFVVRKLKEFNIEYVEQPYDAYEKLFIGEADYMLGGLYYNRMMASRYGIENYMAISKNPLFKIPFFIALSKVTPVFSEYVKVFKEEFAKPEFAKAVKAEIIRIVNEEVEKNSGIVPPLFVRHDNNQILQEQDIVEPEEYQQKGGQIIEQKIKEKTFDEVLEGI